MSNARRISHHPMTNPRQLGSRLRGWYDARQGVIADGARSFASASSQLVSIADNASVSAGDVDYWMACWVRFTSRTGYQYLMGQWDTNNQRAITIAHDASVSRLTCYISGDGAFGANAAEARANNFGNTADSTWYFVLAWHDATNNTVNISVNNGTANSTAHTAGILNSTAPFCLGASFSSGNPGGFLNGNLDSACFGKSPVGGIAGVISTISSRLYNSGAGVCYPQLTESEKTAWGLVSFWCLNEETGTAFDSHGTNHLAASSSAPTFAAGIAAGEATDGNFSNTFASASTQHFQVATNSSLNIGDIDCWWSAWVLMTTKSATMRAFAKWAAPSNREYALGYEQSSDRFNFLISNDGVAVVQCIDSVLGSPATGTWHHLFAWHDSVNNTINLSINNGTPTTTAHTTGIYASGTQLFAIGGLDTTQQQWNGRIDSVAFGKSPVGGIAGQVATIRATLFNSGRGLKSTGITSAQRTAWGGISFWNMEESTGNATDSWGTNNLTPSASRSTRAQGVAYYEGAVSKWLDLSPQQNHLVQTTIASRCTWTRFGTNNSRCVRCDGTDDLMASVSTTTFTDAYIVYYHAAATFSAQRGLLTGTGAGASEIVFAGTNGAATLVTGSTSITGAKTGRWFAPSTTPTVPMQRLAIVRVRGTFGALTPQIGKDRTSAGTFWPNDIHEIILVNNPSPTEDAQIIDYLMTKHGVTR